MGSECLEYSFNAGPKSLNAPVNHHSASLVPTGKEPGFLLKEVFLRQLPADIQAIVTQ